MNNGVLFLLEENNSLFFKPSKLKLLIDGEKKETVILLKSIEIEIETLCEKYNIHEFEIKHIDNIHYFI